MNAEFETIAHVVRGHAIVQPERTALIFEGGGARPDAVVNYGQLWQNAQALARGLRLRGLQRGDVWAVLMANHAEFVELFLASACLGTILVPIDPRTRGAKLAYMLRNMKAVALVTADYALPNAMDVIGGLPTLRWVAALATDEGPSPAQWPSDVIHMATVPVHDGPLVLEAITPDETLEILFTSGTTGDPKGIVVTHGRYCATSRSALSLFGYQQGDRLYSGLSLTHANAQMVTLGASLFGGLPVVFSRRFTKSRLWDITRRYGCTTFTLLGGMTAAIYAEPPRPGDADNPVRLVIAAGMPSAIWRAFQQRFGVQILEFYGTAEGGLAVNPPGVGPEGSCGRLAPGFVARIVNDEGIEVPAGGFGELLIGCADGTPIRVEYVGDPQASARKCEGGWLHTGDILRADSGGWLYFSHRKGAGIRRNGDFINTAFIERAIAETALVEDVYVYGVEAASGAPGEKDVVAAVVPLHKDLFDPQFIVEACRRTLEPNFVPSYIHVMDQIPKTASEKPQDRFLLEDFRNYPHRVHTVRDTHPRAFQ